MVDSQEIIERSFYSALLDTTIKLGLTLNPNLYLPISKDNAKKFERDKAQIVELKGTYIDILGASNGQAKGLKDSPRIVVIPQGFMPGNIGLNKNHLEKVNTEWVVSETPFEAIDQYIEIHLVASNIQTIRLLSNILYSSIPQRGYLKPYTFNKVPYSGNIFIVANNFYDESNEDQGILEKVYVWQVQDTLMGFKKDPDILEPIKDINVDVVEYTGYTKDSLHIL